MLEIFCGAIHDLFGGLHSGFCFDLDLRRDLKYKSQTYSLPWRVLHSFHPVGLWSHGSSACVI